jgi:hypothetical protein
MKTLLALVALLALPAAARELKGVTSPDTLTIAGKELKLNGMGLRTKAIFKVYVASLYVESPSKDPAALISTDQIKRTEMRMLRDVGKDKIIDAIREGFEKNSREQLPRLDARLKTFSESIPDLKDGDKLSFTYVPGKGTTVTAPDGADKVTVEGKDFAEALWGIWLGKDPVSEDMKDGLLGN